MSVSLSQIIRHLNTQESHTNRFAGHIAREIIPTFGDSWLEVDERFVVRPIKEHMCTDTVVGMYAIFLDNQFVMLWSQRARKSDVDLFEVGRAETETLRRYLESFVAKEETPELPQFSSLDIQLPVGVTVDYASQLVSPTHSRAIIRTADGYKWIDVDTLATSRKYQYEYSNPMVITKSGEEYPLAEVLFPYMVDPVFYEEFL